MREVISEKRARQGNRGVRVLMILIASMALATVAWYFVEIYRSTADDKPPPGQIVDEQPRQ